MDSLFTVRLVIHNLGIVFLALPLCLAHILLEILKQQEDLTMEAQLKIHQLVL